MTLITVYDNEEAVPADKKGAYLKGDSTKGQDPNKYYIDELEQTHPTWKKNRELLATNSNLTSANQTLTREKSDLERNVIPQGKVAVDASEAEVIGKLRPYVGDGKLAKTLAELPTVLKEVPDLREKVTRQELEAKFSTLAGAMGWDPEKAKLLLPTVQGLPDTIIKPGKDDKGKDVQDVFALVPSAPGSQTMVEKKLSEIIPTLPALNALLPSLTAQGGNGTGGGSQVRTGVRLPPMGAGAATGAGGGPEASGAAARVLSQFERPDAKPAEKS
jgi:hypothetical protein